MSVKDIGDVKINSAAPNIPAPGSFGDKTVVHETVDVKESNAKFHSSSEKKISDIVAEAKVILKKTKAAKLSIDDDTGRSALFTKLTAEHRDFANTLPIPFKWIVMLEEFSAKVLETFLKSNPTLYWKTKDDWLWAYSKYLAELFRVKTPHTPENIVTEYKKEVYTMLKKEVDEFDKLAKETQEEVEKMEMVQNEERKKKLQAALLKRKLQKADSAPNPATKQ